MNRKYLFLRVVVIFILLCPFFGNAQPTKEEARKILEKTDEALNNINTLVYKINHARKFLSRRDTIHTTAICSLYIAQKDKMKAYNILDLESKDSESWLYGHRRYDGKRVFWANYPIDSLDMVVKPEIYKKRRIRHDVVEGYSHLLMWEFLKQGKTTKKSDLIAEDIDITEEILNNVLVYTFTVNIGDYEDFRDNIIKIYVRTTDYLPVAFTSSVKWENMEEYIHYEVEYIAINPDIPVTAFEINKDETIDAEARYNFFKEKIKEVE